MEIRRKHFENLRAKMGMGKVIILMGPRQVGKTTLIKTLLAGKEHLFLDGDDPAVRSILDTPNTEQIKSLLGKYKLVFIDEGQRIPNIGLTLKIIHDQLKSVQVIVSGSSSFELSGLTQEPLTGRKWTFYLFPVSWKEWEDEVGYLKAEQGLENRLIYGMYPEVITHVEEQRDLLLELTESYLYKDVFALGLIKKTEVLHQLLQALAFQVGSEVSFNELGNLLKIDTKTVISYIELLEQAYVIFRLGPFSRNLRNEIKRNRKIYFYDNGVRNALINNFQPLSMRNDTGALWENFLVSERKKYLEYEKVKAQVYFWRTKFQQEIDYVEERDGQIYAWEFKWSDSRKTSFPNIFVEAYNPLCQLVTRENFRNFLSND